MEARKRSLGLRHVSHHLRSHRPIETGHRSVSRSIDVADGDPRTSSAVPRVVADELHEERFTGRQLDRTAKSQRFEDLDVADGSRPAEPSIG